MKSLKLVLAVAAAAATAAPAMAQDRGWYINFGVEYVDLDQRDDPTRPFQDGNGGTLNDSDGNPIFARESVDVINGLARLGFNISEFFALEGEVRIGLTESDGIQDGNLDNATSDVRVNFGGAGFAVGKFPLNEQFDVFGRVGYHYTELSVQDNFGRGFDGDLDGIAFGGGVMYSFGDEMRSAIRLEYTNYDGDGGAADAFALSIARKF